mgnify:CR=1 FL=1
MYIKYFCLCVCLVFSGCLSHSYHGLAGADKPPDESVIGMTYNEVINRYGSPDRIIPLDRSADEINQKPGLLQGPGAMDNSGSFLMVYNYLASYDILLYYRDRGYGYTFIIEKGKVKSLTSVLNNKSDGLGFRGMGGAIVGGGIGAMSGK